MFISTLNLNPLDITVTEGNRLNQYMRWVRDDVLPLWARSGFDPHTGYAHEGLDLRGPIDAHVKPLATQAKQIYVFSRAQCLGWSQGHQALVNRLFEQISRDGTDSSRSDGYIHSWDSNLKPLEVYYDVFDHAQFMLASIGAYTAFGNGADLRRAFNISEWLNLHFKDVNSGWKADSEKGSNSKTLRVLAGLMEAFLYLFEVTQKQ